MGRLIVSVVIPTWQEAATIEAAIAIVLARAAGVRVVEGAQGCGPQLNAGAAIATGQVLWFVHADARVPQDGAAAIRTALLNPDVVGGNFRIVFGPTKNGRFLAAYRCRHRRRHR